MPSFFAILMLLAVETDLPPGDLLERGIARYRAGEHSAAVTDLSAAAQAFLSPEKMQAYVATGRFDDLERFETSLVYLALAYSAQGNEEEARAAIHRLATAERIEPAFARLQLRESAEFALLAARIAPEVALGGGTAQPPIAVAEQRQQVTAEMVGQEIARIQRDAEARIAEVQRVANERIAELERMLQQQQAAPVAPAMTPREYLVALRDATTLAATGHAVDANAIYNRIAASGAPREIVAEAAVGLYRTGAYRDAAAGFRRLGVFRRGEEDLRYYAAVSYYETGLFSEARRELECALPYIEITSDVARYRERIESAR